MRRVTDDEIAHLLDHGYVLVEGWLTSDELERAHQDLARHVPSWDDFEAAPRRYEHLKSQIGAFEFPFAGDTLNEVCTSDAVVDLAERLLGTPKLSLTQSQIWAKYATSAATAFDQPLHFDFMNNTLVVPRDEGTYRQLPMIIYYDDVDVDLGPTYVVSQKHTRDLAGTPPRWTREERPELYEHEVPVTVPAGSALVYTMRTAHRGSKMEAPRGVRYSHHIVYRATDHQWMGWTAWARLGPQPEMTRFLERATPRQRELLGFPAPGDPYWTAETLEGVGARYPNMDLAPYREATAR